MSLKWERWCQEELAILKVHYPYMAREDLMCLLPGRTWRAIGHQAEKQKIYRPHYGSVRSKQFLRELHITLSTARVNRTDGYAPFAGKQHSGDAKLRISVSNLYARFNCVADIAALKGITEKEVEKMAENRKRRNYKILIQNPHSIAYQTDEEPAGIEEREVKKTIEKRK